MLLTIGDVDKDIKKQTEKFRENHFHNIFTFCDVLPNFPFITNETMRGFYL